MRVTKNTNTKQEQRIQMDMEWTADILRTEGTRGREWKIGAKGNVG